MDIHRTAPRSMTTEIIGEMRRLNLQEHEKSGAVRLSAAERDALTSNLRSVTIEPVAGTADEYVLTPGSKVGALEIDGLSVVIEPKIGIPQLLSIACYAIGKVEFQRTDFGFLKRYALPDAIALALAVQARHAFSHGLLHGYRTEEQSLPTIKGRVDFAEQMRRRFDVPLPVEVRFDDFTDDVLPNRLVKAAVHRLGGMRLRSSEARRNLGWVAGILGEISLLEFQPSEMPTVAYNRLNEHYRGVVELSRLLLRQKAYEFRRGPVHASGLLMDMNAVFQEFLHQALRDTLNLSERTLRSDKQVGRLTLDHERKVAIYPDLTWWDGSDCLFVGDAKYKNVTGKSVPNADIYQILSYATALGLPGGMLIYAKGEAEPASYNVRHSGKRLEIAALDLSISLNNVLSDVRRLADRIVELLDEAQQRFSGT